MAAAKHILTRLPSAFRLGESKALLQNLVEKAAVPTFLAGTDGHVFFANRAFCDLLGYTPDDVVNLGIARIVHPDDAQLARQQIAALAAGGISSYRAERRYLTKSGEIVWVVASAAPLRDEKTGEIQFYTVQAVEISRLKQAEAALAESESRWNAALEGAGQGVWDHDLKNKRAYFSPMWRKMRGIGLNEHVDPSREAWLARVHPEDRQRISSEADRQNDGKLKQNSFEYRERHRDGHWMWILSRGRPIEWMPDGSVARIVGTDTDITALKEQEARAADEAAETYKRHLAALEKAHQAAEEAQRLAQLLARHDPLTGLPNRRVLAEALDKATAEAARGGRFFAVLIIDLDRFKPVNDIHGHPIGDEILREIASRFGSVVRKTDTLARVGGDEFAAIIDCGTIGELAGEAGAQLASRLVEKAEQPISIGDKTVDVGATIGIALCPNDGCDAETLLRAADMAMYRAKEGSRGTYCFFQRDMEIELRSRAALEDDVRRAVVGEQIVPFYQPLMNLTENRIVGFEILARWNDAKRGELSPELFIPVVERIGLISQLTYTLLRRACLDAREWPSDLSLSINVSPKHFGDPLLPVKFLAILSETDFPPKRLEVEITETALVTDPSGARAVLAALRDLGVTIALDDFGTGYSNLYHLRELRFDKIKIDRSFVMAMEADPESAKIVNSVIALARNLGLPTVAEGVEQRETLNLLVRDGAQYGQGHFFGKAMPAADIDRLLGVATETRSGAA
jgi:diguanylate cyclase (GGDEF)-like protein/PAS domain S-box-containing protein